MKKVPEVYVVLATNQDGDTRVICVTTGITAAKREAKKLEEENSFPGIPYNKWYEIQKKFIQYIEDEDRDDDVKELSDGEIINTYIDSSINPDQWNDATDFYTDNDADYVEIVKSVIYNR